MSDNNVQLCNMRRFYESFVDRETVSPELSWSHLFVQKIQLIKKG
jgi:hypothetical protein